jgi:hypothetical protein
MACNPMISFKAERIIAIEGSDLEILVWNGKN